MMIDIIPANNVKKKFHHPWISEDMKNFNQMKNPMLVKCSVKLFNDDEEKNEVLKLLKNIFLVFIVVQKMHFCFN